MFFKEIIAKRKKVIFLLFFNRLFEDYLEIRSIFAIKEPLEKLSGNLSDRHGFGSVLELNFTDGRKIIYKPRSAINDLFLTEYIKILKLDTIYNIHIPKAIDKQKYSWYEFIEHTVCKRKSELENFYRNSGAVLAVLDSLNYTDGHNENFICATPFWYLIDSETILTNLSYFSDKVDFFYGLEFTGIVQKLKSNELSISALQFNNQISYMPVSPFVENDCTENICLHYKTFRYTEKIKGYPKYQKLDIRKYISFIQKGMKLTYKSIAESKVELTNLFEKYKTILRLRQIHRHTIYYYWLLYKFYHPCNLSRNNFFMTIKKIIPII